MTAGLRILLDKEQIRSVMHRYARGVDRRDYDLVRSAYHPDAYDDHGAYQGGVDGLVEWISRRHALIEQSMHLLGQTQIDFLAEDVAVAETYDLSVQCYPAEAEETIHAWVGDIDVPAHQQLRVVMYARFNDRFEKRRCEWKIAHRIVVIEVVDATLVDRRTGPPISVEPVRGPEDALYSLMRTAQRR
ncbi:nuclear transport factor 2 family protein [Nonomuraea lactucae]|uniref:nuclear transport factor 2 family protein n=1 Tax=Nonomuraea lactucae TaxID=2249762 RepID=UPI0013B44AD6|nr:nuclear transport factor 2 family protein [Nonomuraea lactucae]